MQDSPSHLRTALTLAVCAAIVAIAGVWGWRTLTAPLPEPAAAIVCEDTRVSAGQDVFPADVVVTVLNASNRSGLAQRTLSALGDQGFVSGGEGNAPARNNVRNVQIWTPQPASLAVQLVRSWLPKARVVKRQADQPGVVVVVGQDFTEVGGGKKSVKAAAEATICSPPEESVD